MISHAILTHNRGGGAARADGIVVTPSHNPPGDGGFKYNPPHGGPADTDVTGWIQDEANALLEAGLDGVQRVPLRATPRSQRRDYVTAYVDDLGAVIDLDAIRGAGPAARRRPARRREPRATGSAIAERHGLDLEIVNDELDPTFRFVPLDWDGKIRMDCSSPYAMARLTRASPTASTSRSPTTRTPTATGSSRRRAGLLNPNHHLAVCVAYLFGGARDWGEDVGIGKTLVSARA